MKVAFVKDAKGLLHGAVTEFTAPKQYSTEEGEITERLAQSFVRDGFAVEVINPKSSETRELEGEVTPRRGSTTRATQPKKEYK